MKATAERLIAQVTLPTHWHIMLLPMVEPADVLGSLGFQFLSTVSEESHPCACP